MSDTHLEEAAKDYNPILQEEPLVKENFMEWGVQDVICWCIESLELETDDQLGAQVEYHNITGDLLPELSLDDCKELCQGNLNKALQLKMHLNKITKEQEEQDAQDDRIVSALNSLAVSVTSRLQEFQTQYSALRMDLLEIVKSSGSNVPASSASPLPSSRSPSVATAGAETRESKSNPHQPDSIANQHKSSQSHNQKPPIPHPTVNRSLSSMNNRPIVSEQVAVPNEPLKQLRASKEDSCERILKNAMKRHHLDEQDWRQYVLVICYGDQERILELDEKPVVIFKNLKQQGLHPAIMLRHRGDFEELSVTGSSRVTPGGKL